MICYLFIWIKKYGLEIVFCWIIIIDRKRKERKYKWENDFNVLLLLIIKLNEYVLLFVKYFVKKKK